MIRSFRKGSFPAFVVASLLLLQQITAVEKESSNALVKDKKEEVKVKNEEEGYWSRFVLQTYHSYPPTAAPTPSYQSIFPKPTPAPTPSYQSKPPRPGPTPAPTPVHKCHVNVSCFLMMKQKILKLTKSLLMLLIGYYWMC